jgi:hypothetical protein
METSLFYLLPSKSTIMIVIGVTHANILGTPDLRLALETLKPKSIGVESRLSFDDAIDFFGSIHDQAPQLTKELADKYNLPPAERRVLKNTISTYGHDTLSVAIYALTHPVHIHCIDEFRMPAGPSVKNAFDPIASTLREIGQTITPPGREAAIRRTLHEWVTGVTYVTPKPIAFDAIDLPDIILRERREDAMAKLARAYRPDVIVVGSAHAAGEGYLVEPLYKRLGNLVTYSGLAEHVVRDFTNHNRTHLSTGTLEKSRGQNKKQRQRS